MNVLKLIYHFLFRTKRRRLTVKAVLLVAIARLRIVLYPGPKLYRYFGENGGETDCVEIREEERCRDMFYVSDKVARVASRVPWECKCLVQAMVAQRLLRDYGLSSTLYLGVGRDRGDGNQMVAHAWVRCGTCYVCGGNGEGYGVVATFIMKK